MSDTPRTDQAKIAAGFQAVPESFLVFARKLERENIALRADRERLDWLEKHGATPICSRAAIDAARKEQQ